MSRRCPPASSVEASNRMGRVRRRDTAAEVRIRKALHRRGLRYRVDYAPLGGRNRADIVFTCSRIAVFIHGCFWHRCTEHGTLPKANADWLSMAKLVSPLVAR
jgi:DNA mismatch endonuclease (patch repair protein)